MWALSVVNVIELIQLHLEFFESVTQGLFIEPSEQRLMESFVLALRGRFVGFARDRFHPQRRDVGDKLPVPAPPGGIESEPVVREESAWHAVTFDRCAHDPHGGLCGLRCRGK